MCKTHNALKHVLIMAQCFGIFPLNGVTKNVSQLRFTYKSWKIVYIIFLLIRLLFCGITVMLNTIETELFFDKSISFIFYVHNILATLILMNLASKWPKFMVQWSAVEIKFIKNGTHLKRIFKRIAIVLMLTALSEFILSELNFAYGKVCGNNGVSWELYFKNHFHYVFNYFEYSFMTGVFFMVTNFAANFTWNFVDLFLILMSTAMTTMFKQFNHRLHQERNRLVTIVKISAGKNQIFNDTNINFWSEIREDYNKLSKLCKRLDKLLSNLLIASYSNNVWFILVQLFCSLKLKESFLEGFYFYYSFGFVIVRTVAVSTCAARINEESKKPVAILHSLPLEIYNVEINRLLSQIHFDLVALTGHNFFKITKGFILRIAAAIVTYELVLIQFNQTTLEKYFEPTKTCIY